MKKKMLLIIVISIFLSLTSINLFSANAITKSFINIYGDNVTIEPLIDTINKKLPDNSTKLTLAIFLNLKTETFYANNYEAYLVLNGEQYKLDGAWYGCKGGYYNSVGFYSKQSLPYDAYDVNSLDGKEVIFKLKYIPLNKEYSITLNVPENFFKEKPMIDNVTVTYKNNLPVIKWNDPDKENTDFYRIRIYKNGKLYYATSKIYDTKFDFNKVTNVYIQCGDYTFSIDAFEKQPDNIPFNFFNRARYYSNQTLSIKAPIIPYRIMLNNLKNGWNLAGWTWYEKNVVDIFKNIEVKTVWKWDNGKWAIWSPNENIKNLIENYNIPLIKTIKKGEGFWINK